LDATFARQLAQEIRLTSHDRLHRTEGAIGAATPQQREGMARFLLSTADSSPVSDWPDIRGLLEGLAFDIYDQSADSLGTPDPRLTEMFRAHLEAGRL
jgi:hypothetical protein